jgi:hypothetical protein
MKLKFLLLLLLISSIFLFTFVSCKKGTDPKQEINGSKSEISDPNESNINFNNLQFEGKEFAGIVLGVNDDRKSGLVILHDFNRDVPICRLSLFEKQGNKIKENDTITFQICQSGGISFATNCKIENGFKILKNSYIPSGIEMKEMVGALSIGSDSPAHKAFHGIGKIIETEKIKDKHVYVEIMLPDSKKDTVYMLKRDYEYFSTLTNLKIYYHDKKEDNKKVIFSLTDEEHKH